MSSDSVKVPKCPAGWVRTEHRAPQIHPLLRTALLLGANRMPLNRMPLAQARREAVSRLCPPTVRRAAIAATADVQLPGPVSLLPGRFYIPAGGDDGTVIVFLHGGGFVLGGVETHDAVCRSLCEASGTLVFSVGYRLAPEHKFPAGLQDCLAAIRWVVEGRHALSRRTERLFLAGDSAGGNLASVAAMRLAEDKDAEILGQLLLYPMIDHVSSGHGSYSVFADGYGLTKDMLDWYWSCYLPDAATGSRSDVSPLRASNLSGMPSTFLATAEFDVLRDEGLAFASRLAQAGVNVEHIHYDNMNHGFAMWQGLVGEASDVFRRASVWMRICRRS